MNAQSLLPKVLVVDDEPANLRLMGSMLRGLARLVFARNGEQALELASRLPAPDLVILDVVMPGMDGYEVCRRLGDNDDTRDIPVIFVTGRRDEDDEERGLNLGAVDYIHKPPTRALVRARVRNHLHAKKDRDLLARAAQRDGLTGVYNRRRFEERLEREWRRARRRQEPLGLVLLDIDRFKRFNDRYGHLEGDGCLRRVARALDARLRRAADFFARYGGEEFVALLPDTDEQGVARVAESLVQEVRALEIPHEDSPPAGIVTISAGGALILPTGANRRLDLVGAADEALYRVKEGGRDGYLVQSPVS